MGDLPAREAKGIQSAASGFCEIDARKVYTVELKLMDQSIAMAPFLLGARHYTTCWCARADITLDNAGVSLVLPLQTFKLGDFIANMLRGLPASAT
eukprot:2154495-Pyramimonas_sp.AAC.1